jgi:cellulose synthase operon protein C
MHLKRCYRWPLAACCWLAAASALAEPADDQYRVAAGHYAAGRWALAAEEFEEFLGQFPNHALADSVRFYCGEALVQQERYGEAWELFAQFLQRQPDHKLAPQALFRLGEAAYFLKDGEAAEQAFGDFRRRQREHPLNQFVLPYLGDLVLLRGDAAAAKSLYAEALDKHPQGPLRDACRFGLARSLEALGDTAGAERFYRFVAYESKDEVADDAQLRLGLLHYHARRFELAERELARLEKAFPQSENRPHARYWLARSHFARQNWEGAAATLTGLSVPPDHELAPAIALAAGEALARLGRTEEAKSRLNEVVGKWPQSEWADDALQANIDLALATGDAEAIDALASDFVRRFAESELLPSVKLAHGRSLLKREKFQEAAAVFQSLVSGGEHDSAASDRADRYYYYLGLARLGANEFEAAMAAVDRIALDGANPELADGVRVARAAALVGLERFEEAVPLLRQYIASQPSGPDAGKCRAQLVVALTRLGRLAQAAGAHEDLAQRNSDHPHFLPATEFLAESAYQAGDKILARKLFAMLAREGNPPQYAAKGLSGLAWLEFEGNDPAQSAAVFERLLKEHPGSKLAAEAAMMQARSHERLQQFDAAAAVYRMLLEKHGESELAPAAMLALAGLLDRQGKKAEAAALYDTLVKEHPQAKDLDQALYQWAWTLADLHQPEAADAVFARLLDEHPQSRYAPDAAYRLAERAAQRKEYARARQLVEHILRGEAEPDVVAHSLYLQGQVAALEERWPEVAPPMERLLREHSASPLKLAAMYWAAEGYYRQQQYDEAGRRLAELAPLADAGNEAWLAMVPLRQAQVLAHQKQWDEAQQIASGIAARWPQFRQQYEADYLLGRCLMAEAKFSEARDAFERTIRSPIGGQTETAAMAQWMIGETYFHQKNYTEAIKAYYRVERLFPYPRWQAGALLQAGKCHEMRGEFHEAVRQYGQLLKDYADSPFAEEASQRLRVSQKRATVAASQE